jgi:NAD(P)-dependent dehydrogenase (short-subunit alcohol dehydrogenase family)
MGLEKFSLAGKVALVTGSGRGIGRGIALCMAEAGADIVNVGRTLDRIAETASRVKASGRKSICIQADMREADQVKAMVEKATAEFGRIDILVNNVGTPTHWDNIDITDKGWDAIMRENLKTTFLCTQAAARAMTEKGIKGSIINISTRESIKPGGGTAYAAAKAGVNSLTQSWAALLAPNGIRVNCILPGVTVHPVSIEYANLNDPEARAEEEKKTLLGRLGTPEDIGWTAVFLASEAGSYITGVCLSVDGGIA